MPDRSDYEQAALEYCAPRGIPLSTFLNVWSERDQWAALEWQSAQAGRCETCGTDTSESLDIANAYAYRAKALRCHACHAIEVEAARLQGRKSDDHAGTRFMVTRRDREDAHGHVVESRAVG